MIAPVGMADPQNGFVRSRTENGNPLPLILEPAARAEIPQLLDWLTTHGGWVREKMTAHGALLFRGFPVNDAATFETVARAIAPDVTGDFVGTPSKRLTDTVFPASDGVTRYPVSQHSELMYLPSPPTRVFFACLVAPESNTGETPLADNRRVWCELDPVVRERFVRGGLRIVRNLRGPRSRFRLWTQVRWDDWFLTTDRDEVEAQCRASRFDFQWTRDDGLRLIIDQPVTRRHPVTGETVWCNQFLSYHQSSSAADFRRLYRLRPDFRHWYMWQFVRSTTFLKACSPLASQPIHSTHADGSPIRPGDLESLRDTTWRVMARPAWRTGDVLAIDNFACSHGRFPSWGPREIVSCLA
jgi:hypothetical protein